MYTRLPHYLKSVVGNKLNIHIKKKLINFSKANI